MVGVSFCVSPVTYCFMTYVLWVIVVWLQMFLSYIWSATHSRRCGTSLRTMRMHWVTLPSTMLTKSSEFLLLSTLVSLCNNCLCVGVRHFVGAMKLTWHSGNPVLTLVLVLLFFWVVLLFGGMYNTVCKYLINMCSKWIDILIYYTHVHIYIHTCLTAIFHGVVLAGCIPFPREIFGANVLCNEMASLMPTRTAFIEALLSFISLTGSS